MRKDLVPSDAYEASALKTMRRRGLQPLPEVTYLPQNLGLRPTNQYEASNMRAVVKALEKKNGGPFRGAL